MPAIKEKFNLLKPSILISAALIIFLSVAFYKNRLSEKTQIPPEIGLRELNRLSLKIEKNQNDIKSLFERGRLKYDMGVSYWADAAADLETAREKGYLEKNIFLYLGNIYSHLGFYDYAVGEFEKYLNNNPSDKKTYLILGKTYYLKQNYAKALEIFENLKNEGMKDPVLLENIALTKWKLNRDYSETIFEMKKMSKESSCRADYIDGYIKNFQKLWRESEVSLQNAFSSECVFDLPDKAEALRILYEDYVNLKDDISALNALKESDSLGLLDEEGKKNLVRLEKKISSSFKKK